MSLARYFKDLLKAIYLPAFFTGLAQNSLSVLLPLYVLHLGHGADTAAMIFACRAVGGLLSDLPGGKLIGAIGERWAMLLGTLILTLGYAGIAFTTSLWSIGLMALTLGVAAPLNQIGRQVYLTERYAAHERGRIVSLMAVVMRVGTFIGPLIGGFVASAYGYNIVFFSMAVGTGIALILVFFYAEPVSRQRLKDQESDQKSWAVLLEYRQIFLTAGSCMIALRVIRAARNLLIPLIGASIGLEVAVITSIVAAGAFVDALMVLPAGQIMDKYGRKFAAVPTFSIFFLGLSALAFVDSLIGLLVITLMLGLANGLSSGLLFILGSDYAPVVNRGRFLGIWRLVSDIGAAGAPAAIGLIIKAGSLAASGVATGSVSLVAAAIMFFIIREPLQKQKASETDE